MTTFKTYARFYDLLYEDKNYHAEAQFLAGVLSRLAPKTTSLLDIGCGSGRHGVCMAEAGFRVLGVDMSVDMVELARRRAASAPSPARERLVFSQGDIRSLSLGTKFQVAMSLFHVVSYLTTDDDLRAALTCVRRHLTRGGVFVFDFWHAPALLGEGPQRREKIVEAQGWRIHRRTEPEWHKDRDIVRVHFHVSATNANSGEVQEFEEVHAMRYYFPDALAAVFAEHGFAEVERGEWLTGSPIRDESFGVYMVQRAV